MNDQVKFAKSLAKQLAAALAASGQTLPHSNLLEVVAKAHGARTWHAFQSEQAPAPTVTQKHAAWRPEDGPMSQAQYVQQLTPKCPVCGGTTLNRDDFDGEACSTTEIVSCEQCRTHWEEVFNLAGYRVIAGLGGSDDTQNDGVDAQDPDAWANQMHSIVTWVESGGNIATLQRLCIDERLLALRDEVDRTGVSDPNLENWTWARDEVWDVIHGSVLDQVHYLWEADRFLTLESFADWLAEEMDIERKALTL